MRKNTLRKTANQYLKMNRTGEFRDKKQREHVLHKLIHDLFLIKNIPPKWEALTSEHFHQLMKLWRRHQLQPTTIMKHMTIIRRFLGSFEYEMTQISNQALGLKYKKKQPKVSIDAISHFKNTINPIARVLLGLQIHFGLTRSEAMRINPSIHVRAEKLWLTREMTFNSRDRVIPILTKEQRLLLNQMKGEKNLIELYGYDAVRLAWQQELRHLKLPPQKSYRYIYAKQRYEQLKNKLTHYKLQLLIMDEMAIKSRTTLWGYLNE